MFKHEICYLIFFLIMGPKVGMWNIYFKINLFSFFYFFCKMPLWAEPGGCAEGKAEHGGTVCL